MFLLDLLVLQPSYSHSSRIIYFKYPVINYGIIVFDIIIKLYIYQGTAKLLFRSIWSCIFF